MLVLNRWTNHEKDSVRTRQVGDGSRRFRTFTIITVGEAMRFPPEVDREEATAELRERLQAGIVACIADFPVPADPGEWWVPADLGGGAPTEPERRRLDAEDAAQGRRRGPKGGDKPGNHPSR